MKPFVDQGGAGPGLPVLFVHGLAGSSAQWAAQLRHLRSSRRAAALDLGGHGQSPLREGAPISIEAYAGEVVAAADQLGWPRLFLAGFSIGGSVAGCAAATLGPRCAGLFLLDPASALLGLNLKDTTAGKLRASFEEMLKGAAPRTRESVWAAWDATPPEISVAFRNAANGYDALGALRRFLPHGPALALVADGNQGNPNRLHARLPAVREERIEGTSHWAMLDEPDEVNARLGRFLRGVEPHPQ